MMSVWQAHQYRVIFFKMHNYKYDLCIIMHPFNMRLR